MSDRRPGNADRVLVQVRLPRDLVKRIDHLSIDEDVRRTQMLEQLLRVGLEVRERGQG